jgi:hypothetical protein
VNTTYMVGVTQETEATLRKLLVTRPSVTPEVYLEQLVRNAVKGAVRQASYNRKVYWERKEMDRQFAHLDERMKELVIQVAARRKEME